ncbi:MAG: hypothetical protein KAS32_10870 [Candidatus Peribacteraceae bacterium]|nr:hypothetical protein [Candidatus Peribacteraceae bacterium]
MKRKYYFAIHPLNVNYAVWAILPTIDFSSEGVGNFGGISIGWLKWAAGLFWEKIR